MFYATLINDKHFLLSSGNGSTISFCDRLHNGPFPRMTLLCAICCCWSLRTRPSSLHRAFCKLVSLGQARELWLTTLFRATGQQRIKTCVFPLSCSPQTLCPRHFLQATSPLCTDTQGLGTGTQPKIISYIMKRGLNYNLFWHWEQISGCWCQSKTTEPTHRLQHHHNVCVLAAADAVSQ